MKATGISCTATLALFFGVAVQAPCLQSQSQQRPQQELRQSHSPSQPSLQAKPQPPTKNPQRQYQPANRGQQKRTPQRQPPPDKQRDHERPGYHQDNGRNHYNDWQRRRARDWRSDHRTWEQRGGYRGYRIPEDRFARYFGLGHFFRIHDLPVLIFSGYPSFLYRGYWFRLVDPWPEYWAEDWYETDDVYIAYAGDGYYLFNRRYPSMGIAVSISM